VKGKLNDLENGTTNVKDLRRHGGNGREEVITAFMNELPGGLRDQVMEYVRESD